MFRLDEGGETIVDWIGGRGLWPEVKLLRSQNWLVLSGLAAREVDFDFEGS
jgi:hypothetical protein